MNVIFVTAFLDLHEDRSADRTAQRRIELFNILNSTGVRIHLFISPEYVDKVNITNGVKEVISLEDLETYKCSPQGLPETRNIQHDTRNFLILMNAKIEFVYRAIHSGYHSSQHYAWIDFNIFHILDPIRGAQRIHELSTRMYPNTCMYVPGCWDKNVTWSSVNWRFCGGFFLGDVESLSMFRRIHAREYPNCPHLSWEVNVWAYLESLGWTPSWYAADHNNRILDVPPLPIVASLTTIPPRQSECKASIDSLINQVDHIYLAVSTEYNRFGSFAPPDYLKSEPYASKVTVCIGNDYGPASKYIGTTPPNDIWVFICDDDQEYAPDLIDRMRASITTHGVYQNHYESIKQKTSGGMVHGYVGNLIHSSVLEGLRSFPLPDCARFVDDQWVSMFCKIRGISVMPTGVEAYSEIFKVTQNGHEKLGTHSLSGLNTRAEMVRKLESFYGIYFTDKKC